MKSALPDFPSPWTFREKVVIFTWEIAWTLLCAWTPKPLNKWRLIVKQLFGVKIDGIPFVHARARIQIPWNLTLHDRACLGDRANAYSLGEIEIGFAATVAQECYLCTGTHDMQDRTRPLLTAKITVGDWAFLGARTFVLPGVTIGKNCVVGACSVVSKDLPDDCYAIGSPAKFHRAKPPL